jgi:hypothetical protein
MKNITKIFIVSGLSLLAYSIIKKFTMKETGFKKKLIDLANIEWNKWNNPTKIKEGNAKTIKELRDYWRIGANVNGTDSYYINNAWSASFISWLMRTAGAGTDFKYSSLHSIYIRDAIKNRKLNNSNPFKGYKPNEVDLNIGDLVCRPRQAGVNYDTDTNYMSHCDLITEITNDTAIGIGGNVSNSVSKTIIPLKNNKIDQSNSKNSGFFVVIKNLK